MQKLEKLFSCVQTRQAAGKAFKEMKDQIIQQAAPMEDTHKEIATTLIKTRLTDKRQKLERGFIQQYRAKVIELRRTLQEPRPGGKVLKYIKGQCQHPEVLT